MRGKAPRRFGVLVIAALALPLLILLVVAWLAWRDTWRAAERELARGADAAAEYALRVLDTHRLAGDVTNFLLAGLSDDQIREREGDLHAQVRGLLRSLPGVVTLFVVDRNAEGLVTGGVYPVPRGVRVPDREWMVALQTSGGPDLHISAVTTGRIGSSPVFFAVSRRRTDTGNGLPAGSFDGVISVGVDPHRLSEGLATISGEPGDVASLVRADGALLARSSGFPTPPPDIPAGSPLRDAARQGAVRGGYIGRPLSLPTEAPGDARLIAFRRVGELPLYATMGRPTPRVVARWRETVLLQFAVGLPAWAGLVVFALLLQRKQRALASMNAGLELRVEERTAELRDHQAQLLLAQRAARAGSWAMDPNTGDVIWSDEQFALFGLDPTEGGRMSYGRFFNEIVYPEDRPVVAAAAEMSAKTGEFDADFRVWRRRPDGTREVRWMTARARRFLGPDGAPGRIYGVNVDITERKAAEERQTLLMREVNHRAKNALAVVQAALRLTRKDDVEGYAQAIEGRVGAIARAHTILAAGQWESAAMRDVVQAELAAFQPGSAGTIEGARPEQRVVVDGPDIALAPDAVQAMSMVLHELATNATKYGALSVLAGRVWVTWWVDSRSGKLTVIWRERDGPRVDGTPARRGFGSRVVEATVEKQLGGRVARVWEEGGLVCVMTVPLARAAAATGATAA
ncbi:HWE histidine kinase domain-containing protein [Falsiroseomonas sp. HW251]|uniref:HWE histidine kinase domain-containing protein n=1 Tax=Falsiroseomonas sp. HW251 TaxID=3390998 RepID=UPI003D31E74E